MFSKSKGNKKRNTEPDKKRGNLAQFGLLDIPNVTDFSIDDEDEDNADLEAELLKLTTGKQDRKKIKKARNIVSPEELDKMVADCMKDDIDHDLSDEEDAELMAELSALGPGDDDDEEESSSLTPPDSSSISGSDITTSPVKYPSDISPIKPQPPNQPTIQPPNQPTIVHPAPIVAGHSVIALLNERIAMYEEAEQNAIYMGETSRARRFNRGLKTLNQMLKSVKSGKAINENDIPPAVLTKSSRSNSNRDVSETSIGEQNEDKNLSQSQSALVTNSLNIPMDTNVTLKNIASSEKNRVTSSTIQQNIAFSDQDIPTSQAVPDDLSILMNRQKEYKMAAVSSKRLGNQEEAVEYLKVYKQLTMLVEAARNGQKVDISSLPSFPPAHTDTNVNTTQAPYANVEERKPTLQQEVLVQSDDRSNDKENVPNPTENAASVPTTILEALEQRLEKYTQQLEKAKAEENARKERMNQRIIKQYQDAIKQYKAGKPVPFDELPSPPGFPPIPTPVASTPVAAPSAASVPRPTSSRPAPAPPTKDSGIPSQPIQAKQYVRKAPQSRVERQLSLLQKRQTMFKEAAIESKQRGEIDQAKEYLRNYKGFEQLITATNSGLPVDMNTVPIPPQEKLGVENTSLDFEVVDKEDCAWSPNATPSDISLAFTKLEDELISQIKMCAQTREHFKAMGDVASSNRFEQMIINTKKDLDAVRVAFKRGDRPPKYHYENRSFTIIQCNTDLNDSDCEVTVLRGINYNVQNPKDLESYVKIEFPYPIDAPPQERTEVVKDTNCPEYNHKVVFSIDRKARALARIFKRQSVKCYIISRGGWFHRDSTIGTVKVPLVSLENKCTLHESFDLYDDKKKMVGGKLEVKVRVRNPIISKQLEKITEKWIVIDGF